MKLYHDIICDNRFLSSFQLSIPVGIIFNYIGQTLSANYQGPPNFTNGLLIDNKALQFQVGPAIGFHLQLPVTNKLSVYNKFDISPMYAVSHVTMRERDNTNYIKINQNVTKHKFALFVGDNIGLNLLLSPHFHIFTGAFFNFFSNSNLDIGPNNTQDARYRTCGNMRFHKLVNYGIEVGAGFTFM
jgi:hypothetical protein